LKSRKIAEIRSRPRFLITGTIAMSSTGAKKISPR